MQFSRTGLVLALSTIVAAAPYEKRWSHWGSWGDDGGRPWWSGPPDTSYLEIGKRILNSKTAATCNLAQASLPQPPIALPTPAEGLALSHVAIGRGTQNYTCDLQNATAVPKPVGAVATLFNVSCMAADIPELMEKLPSIALNLPVPSADNALSPAYQDMSGHHYFVDDTTPFFNMDTALHQYGTGAFQKANASAAPGSAPKGQYGSGDGSVAWLKLDAKDTATGQTFQEVYRTNTAGGSPPDMCTGMQEAFEVQYSALYWIYEKTTGS
ncbi:hypothetical protein KC363_g5513 [Hortaea werneckii]|uniref:Malate dehydrogenase n=1 Tax=Hortaea werneckii TaxID=91943 RepID=A0A3M7FHU1_HORWE|nr:hypothetical protein KC361_g2086 [Hortaea werneckii]KAI6879087.1 hypothetical protein KC325_g8192 [Hortaea werneckii]KAI6986978.1 hypothetical protein KC359_g8513 [Hortaea werneckii]KAI7141183.1 hypothetical protein KC344_g8183 [Hortaea werneckii]KAI7167947.1 hypothetical protein KC360_g8358 [Hortaea werneckii]